MKAFMKLIGIHYYNIYCYFYETDLMFTFTIDENDDCIKVEYEDKIENEEGYKKVRKLKKINEKLDNMFLGKTESEMIEKCNNGELETYVLDNSKNIIEEIEFSIDFNGLWVEKMVFSVDENEMNYCEYNTIFLETSETGIYTHIIFTAGT